MNQPSQQPDPTMRRLLAAQTARRAVESMLDYTGLPAPTLIPRPDVVHVLAADVDDLGQWLTEVGGEIHVSPPFGGVQMWTLHTSTGPRTDGTSARIQVSVPVPAGEEAMDYIRAAVVPCPEDRPIPYSLTSRADACTDCGAGTGESCDECHKCPCRCRCSGAADMVAWPGLLAAVPAQRGGSC